MQGIPTLRSRSSKYVLPQLQDFALSFTELQEVLVRPFLQLVEVSPSGSTTLNGILAIPPSCVSSADLLRVYSDH